MSTARSSAGRGAPPVPHGESPARTLARFACGLRCEAIPAPVLERARYLILDAVGVALGCVGQPFAAGMIRALRALGGEGDTSVIGSGVTLPLRDAATVNAALVHGLDFDDTHMEAVVHATSVSLPSALAMGERVNAAGHQILAAYVAAMETAIRIGRTAAYGFHRNGYHATGVVGHFSAAIAAGRLLGLTPGELGAAQGIVLSTATASREYFVDGSWNKRLHPGFAAVAGITAAYLARDGFLGSERPYEGRFGVFRLHMGEEAEHIDFGMLTRGLGEEWALMEVAVKPYPTCHYTHALIDSAIALKAAHDLRAADIARIRILVPEQTRASLDEPRAAKRAPASDYAARFSAPYAVACALLNGKLGLKELEPRALGDPAVRELCALCECEPDPDSAFPRYFSGGVIVETRDGRRLRHHEPVNRGAGDRQLSNAEIEGKFMDNASAALGEARARALASGVMAMDRSDGRQLGRLLRDA